MTRAKVFQGGNSQAVRLPLNMRLDVTEADIIRHGNTLIMRPIEGATGLEGDFLPDGRDQGESQEREAL